VSRPLITDELLDRADAERLAGRGDAAARLYGEAIARCRPDDDLDGWTRAVLGAASVYVFGTEPGKLPAELYDLLARTTDLTNRARLSAALARCWAYAGQAGRAALFAAEAVEGAESVGSPELLADCLDAALAAHWGPDELDIRVALATRLDDVTAHVLDPESRLQAHLWGLQVACEALELQAMHRHMRALELLGEESPRAQFFAATRRLMLDLLRGRTDTATELLSVAQVAAQQASLADSWMVLLALTGYTAVLAGDRSTCASMAAGAEEFALNEGVTVVCAEAAFLWFGADDADRARALVNTFHGRVLQDLPRDVNWLLTLQCVLEAALFVEDVEAIRAVTELLMPYAGRAVFNAGAVMFHGVTDDSLARAAAMLGDADTAERLRQRALATYERLGASWWRDRLLAFDGPVAQAAASRRVRLHPAADGLWLIGPESEAVPLRALRGYGYLRALVRRPGLAISALDLVGGGPTVAQSGLGEVLDREAREAYKRRLRDIEQDLAEAEEWADLGRLEALQNERDALVDELAAATGLGGRSRVIGSSSERARIAVTKAITTATARIATIHAPLGRHLRVSIRTGSQCSYEPDPDEPWTWILEP
jgi:hypothetical protein